MNADTKILESRLLLLAEPRLSALPGALDQLKHEIERPHMEDSFVKSWGMKLLVVFGSKAAKSIATVQSGPAAFDEDLLRLIDEWATSYPGLGVTPLIQPPADPVRVGIEHGDSAPAQEQTRAAEADVPAAQERPTRDDAMSIELGLLVDQMRAQSKKVTPGTVMFRLRERAGSESSCVEEKTAEGVLWRRGSGQQEKLTIKNLESRLRRKKQR